ncbi:alpha/beta-hydrolase [Zopfia rhizophila CBS 207.26]|uniref:Alpha/beta-hydrolase n=1 Tax=Zopfia rhizophila CBS 207.26 TaxID=1314779 RepID=A0A6A6DNA9_9PEZI|nr:alpha/beta-hydrolase [Zopfia rhizophila CBS 207.26]
MFSDSEKSIFEHSTLGCKIGGKVNEKTIQYRNLKYASIPGRWCDSILLDSLPSQNGMYDATRFGPSCPQKRGSQAWDLTLVGNEVLACVEGQGDSEVMDELECLNLNVTVPKETSGEGKRRTGGKGGGLPVFVWVHGGGLSMGSNSWPQYDLQRFVKRSVEIGKPVIGVSVNYRVGILGFLASGELGVEGNFGYKDQINAFRWIRKHIAGFGGDPDNITACGESAGGVSLSTLLFAAKEPLFDRAVIMSGEATLRKPRKIRWHNGLYQDQLKFLGLKKLPKVERAKRLRDMDAEEMCQKLSIAQHFCACVDGEFLKGDVTLSVLGDDVNGAGKPGWCREVVVGDTAHDGTVLKARILDDPNAIPTLHSLCKEMLLPSETESLLTAYYLRLHDSSEAKRDGLLALASELRFHLPALQVAKGWKGRGKVRRYHFHAQNPIKGMFKGLASHELDVALLLQNFNHAIPAESQDLARKMAEKWIQFANGEGWCEDGEVVVFEDGGLRGVGEEEYDRVWRNGRGELLKKIGAEKLFWLSERLQGVRGEEDARAKL